MRVSAGFFFLLTPRIWYWWRPHLGGNSHSPLECLAAQHGRLCARSGVRGPVSGGVGVRGISAPRRRLWQFWG